MFGKKADSYEAIQSLVVALDAKNLATAPADTAGNNLIVVEAMGLYQVCKKQYFRWGGKATSSALGVGLGIATSFGLSFLFSAMSGVNRTQKAQQWQRLKNRCKQIGLSVARFADMEFIRKGESVFTILKPILFGRLGGDGVQYLEG